MVASSSLVKHPIDPFSKFSIVCFWVHKKIERGLAIMNELDKRIFKKNDQELQEYLQFKRRGTVAQAKKGKGSYSRKQKHKSREE